jgi:hypothetical protein
MRPVAQDLGYYWESASEWILKYGSPRVLLLGVTPELYCLPWPKGTDFLAVDRSRPMIENMWPGPREAVRCADWLDLDLPHGSRDIVLCDGGLHLLRYPQEQKNLIRLIRSVLSDQGLCIFRLFALPSRREPPDAVIEDLLEGKIKNNSILKMRLSMALIESPEEGVALGQVYRMVYQAAPDLVKLASQIGWTIEHTLTINNYKDLTSRFYFLSIEQATGLFCFDPGGFLVHRLQIPSYELGRRCPIIALKLSNQEQSTGSN